MLGVLHLTNVFVLSRMRRRSIADARWNQNVIPVRADGVTTVS
jgi:hypothetical protein